MRRLSLLFSIALCACTGRPSTSVAPIAPVAGAFDIVISHGRIVDGTGDPWFHGDVGISGDRITRITPAGLLQNAPARRRIDARGLVVAPGVIDIQAHSEEPLLTDDSRVVSMITQGVTTMIMGEGDTPAPMNDRQLALMTDPTDSATRRAESGFTGPRGFDA